MTRKVAKEVVWAGGNSIGTKVPDGYHTRSKAAVLIGRHPDTLRKWRKEGMLIPSAWMKAGKLKVFLYDDEDIAEGKRIARGEIPKAMQ